MKLLLTVATAILLLSACAEGNPGAGGAGTGSITMYGTLDEGITFHK